ncbi:carbohydrate ABC transporter permease [Halanaerobium kushneri]|jgi:multiple sugar transport system permease protein|uniref:Carbohydrate ABC transporter membrane protein 2, CUT1 family n=1 Tax=Halanaerobium kushneri TaxID=56779 RepID=A0A1N6R1I0_9FIRM|nr:carbohydrate ABC transporter permease [Halanaerobium kushneri]SIQ22770.1 carbohydrate ABC transporter membrane protein 2, CUT1 family [Halanaerobium kushneri]
MREVKKVILRLLYNLLVVVLSAFFVLPILWLIFTPFNENPTLALQFPLNPTLENFSKVIENDYAIAAFKNSLIQSFGATFLVLFLASLAAYAFSRVELPGKNIIMYILVLFSSIVTGIAAMVPLFFLLLRVGLIDTHLGVILVFSGGFLPTAVFLLKDFVDSISTSYEESAIISGASKFQIFKDIIFPLSRPGMVVIGVYTFVQVWSNFLIPFLFLRSEGKMPASVAIYSFTNQVGMPKIDLISTYSLLYTIPVIALYLFANKKYGFRFYGGLKG